MKVIVPVGETNFFVEVPPGCENPIVHAVGQIFNRVFEGTHIKAEVIHDDGTVVRGAYLKKFDADVFAASGALELDRLDEQSIEVSYVMLSEQSIKDMIDKFAPEGEHFERSANGVTFRKGNCVANVIVDAEETVYDPADWELGKRFWKTKSIVQANAASLDFDGLAKIQAFVNQMNEMLEALQSERTAADQLQ